MTFRWLYGASPESSFITGLFVLLKLELLLPAALSLLRKEQPLNVNAPLFDLVSDWDGKENPSLKWNSRTDCNDMVSTSLSQAKALVLETFIVTSSRNTKRYLGKYPSEIGWLDKEPGSTSTHIRENVAKK